MDTRELSERLLAYRTDRPDEWQMDSFRRSAEWLEMENARLQSVIDEANAQEPLARGYKNSITGTCSELYWLGEAPEGDTNLYARPLPAQAIPEGSVVVSTDDLKRIHRDLDACQKVIWLAGGFDPAYCKDAQESLKLIDSALSASPKP